jgi:hypothetical protein
VVGRDPDALFLAGAFRGGIDFGTGVLPNEGEIDIFVAKLAP